MCICASMIHICEDSNFSVKYSNAFCLLLREFSTHFNINILKLDNELYKQYIINKTWIYWIFMWYAHMHEIIFNYASAEDSKLLFRNFYIHQPKAISIITSVIYHGSERHSELRIFRNLPIRLFMFDIFLSFQSFKKDH